VETSQENAAGIVDVEPLVSHFIHSVQLTGSRRDKLRKLDTLITYLEQLRRALGGEAARMCSEGSGYDTRGGWHWFAAGVFLGAVSALLLRALL